MQRLWGYEQGGDLEARTLTPRELGIVRNNLQGWEAVFRVAEGFCVECGYPLKPRLNYRVAFVGDVCGLCWDMYSALHGRAWFVAAHAEWEAENKGRAKIKRRLMGDRDGEKD